MRPSKGYIEEAAFFLDMEIALGKLFFHQAHWKLEQRGAIPRREGVGIHAQQENVGEFQAFRAVDGHELHGVARRLVFQADAAVSLLEVFKVLQKLGQAALFGLGFPILHKLRQLVDVLAVLCAGALRNFQPFGQIGQDFASAATAHTFALLA